MSSSERGNAGAAGPSAGAIEEVEVHGHIIDSLLLPKILDRILQMGGTFEIRECRIGSRRVDPSHARIAVFAEILGDLVEHGASRVEPDDARTVPADIAGAFPEDFYSTTNQKTQVRLDHHWHSVADQEMDCGIVVDPATKSARCIAMTDVELGMQLICGHAGVRVFPEDKKQNAHSFEFMNSAVS